jgi:DEAD/DEAH box helicase domain-containing protein
MSLSDLIDAWREDPSISANVTAWRTLPARAARTAPLPKALHPALAAALHSQGIEALYTHQAAAWACVQAGGHPAIVTGTASGKTLCYNLPVLDCLLRDANARALYLFPTKALAQDQQTAARQLIAACARASCASHTIPLATYDGDTRASDRPTVRQTARIVLSNPDMLHAGVLPRHTQWAEFFCCLRYVVIDEMHTYRGVFGSHVANVIRRLKRVARFYGASSQFILTSATIGNPAELAEGLIEEQVTLIDDDGAAYGEKHFLVYNPPIVDADLGLRRSVLQEGVLLARELREHDVQSIIFGRTRRTVELMVRYLREANRPSPPAFVPQMAGEGSKPSSQAPPLQTAGAEGEIRGYRSGYLPRQRREIERGLREGEVRAVVATTALELGIDIGGMGAAVLAGYPGTIASTWQQAGRAGRTNEASLAVLIAGAEPLEQFLARHPDYLFGRSPEQARIDPDNLLILLGHIRCAAFELPFRDGDGYGRVSLQRVAEYLDILQESGEVIRSGERMYWMAERCPAGDISLRSTSPERVVLQSPAGKGSLTIGEVDLASAHWMIHPGAVYIHQGQTYLVEELDLESHLCRLREAEVNYYTQARSDTSVQIVEQWQQALVKGATKTCGEILVTSQVTGYRKIDWHTQEQLGIEPLDLPPTELLTTGYWLAPSESTIIALRRQGLWRGDPNQYGPNWAAQRDRARARDGYRCQVCGTPERVGAQGRRQSHHVHHKTPFRAFVSYREANRLDNLATLCARCHLRVEQAVRIRSGLSGLAHVLGHLASLHLMCDRGDMGVQSDPRSPLADGQPAIVLYDQLPGGVGFSQRLYALHDELVARAHEWVSGCACADGCPSCVGPGGEEGAGGKQETLALLRLLIK